jgi:hypothetical protein
VRQIGGRSLDIGWSIAIDNQENVYVGGVHYDSISFENGQTLSGSGGFVAVYTTDGVFSRAQPSFGF